MPMGRGSTYVISGLTVDKDIDMLGLYQVKNLANPANTEALKKNYAGIVNADVNASAGIVESKLSLAQGTQALYDKIATDIASHAGLFTGIHGIVAVIKPDDQIVNNSETLVNDEDLVIAVGANDVWLIHLLLFAISPSATPDMDIAFAVPDGGAIRLMQELNTANFVTMADGTAEDDHEVSTTENGWHAIYVYIGGGTAGNLQFQWAQHVATVEDTRLKTNSLMLCHQIA